MSPSSDLRHPVIPLLAYIEGDVTASDVESVQAAVEELQSRNLPWIIGPPVFIDEVDDDNLRTVGVLHEIYAAFDDDGSLLDEQTDHALLHEVSELIASLQRVGQRSGGTFVLEMNGVVVGWIESGALSAELTTGLIDPWTARFIG